jgi:hypothetical protein
MEDFLKDRPVVSLSSPGPTGAVPTSVNGGTSGPFAPIRRDSSRPAAATPAPAPAGSGASRPVESQTVSGEHGTHVQTIVERGRVTKIIVTCTCGKVTEISCVY